MEGADNDPWVDGNLVSGNQFQQRLFKSVISDNFSTSVVEILCHQQAIGENVHLWVFKIDFKAQKWYKLIRIYASDPMNIEELTAEESTIENDENEKENGIRNRGLYQ